MRTVVAIALPFTALAAVPATTSFARAAGMPTSVIVRAAGGLATVAQQHVEALGGRVVRALPIIDGFSATIPAGAVTLLQRDPAVLSVTGDETLRPMAVGYSATADMGSMFNLTSMTGAQQMWQNGWTGKGIDIAVIDSGVVSVDSLSGKFVNGPDLSWESQSPKFRYLDTYGHGTHMSGIIAGRSKGARPGQYAGDTTDFLGMAPDARIVSVKVADSHGATDVSQVIAAIDWVVQHRYDNGMDIRVLNLSYGTNSTQSSLVDPLSYAAEVAWKKGIVVVVAAGNAGYAQTGSLTDPARDPWVLAVGSSETNGTPSMADDTVSTFSSSNLVGIKQRLVDLVAPGGHVVSLRDPGAFIDRTFGATGAVTSTLFRGSGTSQAAAVVSGAVALVLQQRPGLKPDEVKRLLTSSATTIASLPASQGNGELDLAKGIAWPNSTVVGYRQTGLRSGTGTGSIERARGSQHLTKDGDVLSGEQDISGTRFKAPAMATAAANGNTSSGGTWNGWKWTGDSWSGNSWSGAVWSGNSWSGNSWSSLEWADNAWSGNSWSGDGWAGNSWSGNSWSGNSWSGDSWSGNSWSSAGWR